MNSATFPSIGDTLTEGCPNPNIGVPALLSPTYDHGVVPEFAVPRPNFIDPQLLHRRPTLAEERYWSSDSEPGRNGGYEQPGRHSSLSNNLPPANKSPDENDFDIAFREADMDVCVPELQSGVLDWLKLWVSQNKNRFPSTKELESLEILARTPGTQLMEWLRQNVKVQTVLQRGPRCLDSNVRYLHRKLQSGEANVFECTNGCGQTFSRKFEWTRHERGNFEEWVCRRCSYVFPRKDKLGEHLTKTSGHDILGINLEDQRRQFLAPNERPCGFCGKKFDSWEDWLKHVAAHFKGSIPGGVWKMSEWKEYRNDDDDDGHHYTGGSPGRNSLQWSRNIHNSTVGNVSGRSSNASDKSSDPYSGSTAWRLEPRRQEGLTLNTSTEPAAIKHTLDNPHEHAQHPIQDPTHDLAHRMSLLDVCNTGVQRYFNDDATASEYSCSCTDCMKRLHCEIPAVATDAPARSGRRCRRFGDRHYSKLERYIDAPPEEDVWTVLSAEARSIPLLARLNSVLIETVDVVGSPPVTIRPVL